MFQKEYSLFKVYPTERPLFFFALGFCILSHTMSFGPSDYRSGGTRGGANQFQWDSVKSDKYRLNYLGNSLHAPVGSINFPTISFI